MHRIDGPGATVDNRFTEGDPVGGIQATVVTDDFLNDVQEELMSVLTAAGVAPVKGTQNQVLQAVYKLAQNQTAQAFTTGGTGTALTLTPSPAISAYAANQRFSVKFHVGSGANPTLNASSKGAKALKQYGASGAKVAAVFFADQIGDVVYDGEDFILLGQASSSTGTTPAQFDNSSKFATTAFVQGVGFQFSALIIPAASMTLTAAAAGSVIVGNSPTAITITLPAASTMPGKTAIKFWNYAVGAMTIAVTGPDSIYLPSTNTSVVVTAGSFITLVSNGGSGWYAVDMSGAGTGQAYFNMTGLRVSGTTYPNSTGKEIEVTVNLTSGAGGSVFSATVAGSAVKTSGQGAATTNLSLSFKVPAGLTYSFSSGSGSIVSVWEYR
ncbi:hypothetical protein [Pseudomonas fluorescens]|uniref:hypothetical protein n=1 Tax=Pseudomonas fluorescens TaxID=294 RepID=UPI00125BADD2|nr:hypothetical protein [Pseudomonas fluorescens]VVN81228.1 hypothetical protein PS720_01117 [Pseudomonas fluorescens]